MPRKPIPDPNRPTCPVCNRLAQRGHISRANGKISWYCGKCHARGYDAESLAADAYKKQHALEEEDNEIAILITPPSIKTTNCEKCKYHKYCVQIEPLGELLPCEGILSVDLAPQFAYNIAEGENQNAAYET